jgi:hypothetical protein
MDGGVTWRRLTVPTMPAMPARWRPIGSDVVKAEADYVLKKYTEAGWEITQPVQWAYDSLLQRSEW